MGGVGAKDNELLTLNAEKKQMEPLAANQFFTVGNLFEAAGSRERKDVGISGVFHKP